MKDKRVYIQAAYDCIQAIDQYTKGYTLDQFLNDNKTQDAVIRNLEVLGQTIKDFGVEDLKRDFPNIPWSQIVGMRNIIAHEYLGLDKLIIWETIKNPLQSIATTLEEIIQFKK